MAVIESKAIKSTSLYYKAGSSDKVYNASIEEVDGKYVVNFSYGRRGSALKSGSKTNSPVSLKEAENIFIKLINEKTTKGYKVLENTSNQILVDLPDTPVEAKCVLLNPINENEVIKYCEDEDWIAQEKVDGVRFMLHKNNSKVTSYNRKGSYANIPVDLYNFCQSLDFDFLLDGELVGDFLYVFDILEYNNQDYKETTFEKRFDILKSVVERINFDKIVLTTTEFKNKKEFVQELKSKNKEGVVFKNKNSNYYTGRPASGGSYLKFKFYSTCSCVVKEINKDKRSVSLKLFKNKKSVNAGNVSIPVNYEVPEVDQVVEVRYLYAIKQSGSLYQPSYLGVRTDIYPEECQVSQLKYKSEDDC